MTIKKKAKPLKKVVNRKSTGKKGKKTITVTTSTKKRKTPKKQLECSLREEEFSRLMVIYNDRQRAAGGAGYTKHLRSVASRLLKKDSVVEKINKYRRIRSDKLRIEADYVLTTIQEEIEKCKNENDHNGVYKGVQMLGQHLRMFDTKSTLEVVGDPEKPIVMKWQVEICSVTVPSLIKTKESNVIEMVKDANSKNS